MRLTGAAGGLLLGLQAATQFVAWAFAAAPALGRGWPLGGLTLFPPWAVLAWRPLLAEEEPRVLAAAGPIVLLGLAAGLALGVLAERSDAPRRNRGWGGLKAAREAGLRAKGGCILGELSGKILATEDLRPTLVTGGTRSGKGRGHVVPTLLSWSASTLVHDPKGELWRVSAGFRRGFSHALFFNPRHPHSARWNPLAEIEPGPAELGQVQRLVAILSDPGGRRDDEAIWDKAASEILQAVMLHVLYTAEDEAKSLLTVRELLADLDDAADQMIKTHHRPGPDGKPACHPFIRTAARG